MNPPKPSELRKLEGMRGHRKVPPREPQYPKSMPRKPKRISPAAGKIWDEMVKEMGMVAVLRSVDQRALWHMCEDQALLDEAYAGIWKMAATLQKKADLEGRPLSGGPMMALLTLPAGRGAANTIRDIAARVIVENREFGLTPSARTRIQADSINAESDPLDDALFHGRAELLVLPKQG